MILYMIGMVGIVVNIECVKKLVFGIKDFFVVENKGCIVVVDDGCELVVVVMYMFGLLLNDVMFENIVKVCLIFKEWMLCIKFYDFDSLKMVLFNGDVDIGYVWSGEVVLFWKEDWKF